MTDRELHLVDKRPHLTGHASYLDDLKIPGLHYLSILRSPYAHAHIKRIDYSSALNISGVKAVFTGDMLRSKCGSLDMIVEAAPQGSKIGRKDILPFDRVRFVGEPIAAIVAESSYKASDALEKIEVEYEGMRPVTDPLRAMETDAPLLYDELGTNVAFRWQSQNGNVEEAFRSSYKVLTERFRMGRVAGVAMEPRGIIATYDKALEQLTIWSATHRAHALKTSIAEIIGHPENKIRVITPQVGGSFGSKTNTYAEEVLVAFITRQLGIPVKWVATRKEENLAATHGRDMVADVSFGFTAAGDLLATKIRIVEDLGAYWHRFAHGVPRITARLLPGCYKVQNYAAEVVGVYTNKMATHVMRGTGRPEASYMIEKIMDRIAGELGIDVTAVREKNFIPPNAFPYNNPAGYVYDTGDYRSTMRKALEIANYPALREEQKRMREQGKLVGVGVASYVEVCSGPGGWEYAEIRVELTGRLTVLAGISSSGQSTDAALKQIVASEMGVDPQYVEVITGDTGVVPYGWGSIASRSLMAAGTAVLKAARTLKERLVDAAVALLERNREELAYNSAKVYVKASPEISLSLAEIASQVYAYHGIGKKAQQVSQGLNVSEFCHTEPTFPHGTHLCMVEVDPETGTFKILKYVAVDDCGKVLNEKQVDGQIVGGIVFGFGQTWLEEMLYDSEGNNLTSTLMDYSILSATEVPDIVTSLTETPSRNPLGVKGAGEGGVVGALPAVANAVEDALTPLGVKLNSLPLRPEDLWSAIRISIKP